MTVRIRKGSSRLVHSDLVIIDGIEFWTRPNIPDLEPATTDVQHEVKGIDRIDVISKQRYQNDGFWWTIAHRNNLRLLPCDLIVGNRIVISDPSKIRRELF